MDKKSATEIKRLSTAAIEALSELLLVAQRCCSTNEYEATRRTVGSIIGTIQIDLLEPLNAQYPELDDLKC